MMHRKVLFVIQLILALTLATMEPALATVKVGNGGDVIDSYLQNTRNALVQVVARERPNLPVWQQCYKMKWLNDDQKALCAEFTRAALQPIFGMNIGSNATKLVHIQEPIVTQDIDGSSRRVAAGTECGPSGPILFHYDTIRTYSPRQLFQLVAHEFGHKFSFWQKPCVSDNEAIGAFSNPGGGRELLDAFAWALTQEAIERQEIGDDFGIIDVFRCGWSDDASGISSSANVVSQRIVYDKGVFDRFETGVGLLPRDSMCSLANPRREPGVKYVVQLKIAENTGCRNNNNQRRTEIAVLKIFEPAPNGTSRPAEEIAHNVFEGVNPICEKEPRDFTISFGTSYGSYSFTTRYLTTQTLTNRSFQEKSTRSAHFYSEE